MGSTQQDLTEKRKTRRRPETVAADRGERKRRRGAMAPACWCEAPNGSLERFLVSVTEAGGGVLFGKTRDGGALCLTVYYKGGRTTEYLRPSDSILDLLDDLLDDLEIPKHNGHD